MYSKKIIEFIKETLKIENIDIENIFQDGYQLYYGGIYVGNISHLV